MDSPKKSIGDDAFASHVLAEQERMAEQDGLTAAERQIVRELLGYVAVIRAIVEERRWQAETWVRMDKFGGKVKSFATGITALASAGSLIYVVIKYFGG